MIDERIEFYKKENARLFALIDSANPQNVNDLMIKTINEHEAVIRELKHIKKLNIGDVSTRESLSDYAHESWSGWMKYMFSKAEKNINGTWLMPKWAVERWQRQMNTKYTELPEEERKSDREEADKMLNIIHGC